MKKFLAGLLFLASLCGVKSVQAADVYIAQSAAGGGTGANCANARTVSGTTWTAGNNYHLCGTLTSAVTPNANGTSLSHITITFESGSKISMPAIPNSGAINLSSRSWFDVDGNSRSGIIESTQNGTGQANHINSVGVRLDNASNTTVHDITFQNLFKNVCCSDGSQFGQATYLIGSGTNLRFYNNVITGSFSAVQWQATATSSNLEADHNSLPDQSVGWGIVIVMGDVGFQVNGVFIHDNDITPGSGTGSTNNSFTFIGSNSWCTGTSNMTHLDPIHTWSQGSSPAGMFQDYIYNNYIHGYFCVNQSTANSTTGIFWEAHVSGGNAVNDAVVFNNLVLMTGGHPGDGAIYKQSGTGGIIYNNTVDCTGADSGAIGTELASGNATYSNNIIQHCSNRGLFNSGATVTGTDNILFSNGTNNTTGLTGTSTSNPNLDSSFVPNTGSFAITYGANLTSVGIIQLDTGKPLLVGAGNTSQVGVARPASPTGWTAGAYQFGSVTPIPSSPTINGGASIAQLPNGTVGTPYSFNFIAAGGIPPYSWTQNPTVPGLSISTTGVFSGIPTTAGTYNEVVVLTDSSVPAKTASVSPSLLINPVPPPVPLSITTNTIPGGVVGTAYTTTIQSIGGTPPYSCSGTGVFGLIVNTNCTITGAPSTAGSSTISVTVHDSAIPIATASIILPITITATPPPNQPYQLSAVPSSISLTAAQNGAAVKPTVVIDDNSPNAQPFTVSCDKAFCTVSASNNSTTKSTVTITLTPTGLPGGLNTATVKIVPTNNVFSNAPLLISINFTITVPPPAQIATPQISPIAGSYVTSVTVTLTDSTAGSTITYTTNGTTPVPGTNGTVISSGGSIVLTSSATVKAIGSAIGLTNSSVASSSYIITAPPSPTISCTRTGTNGTCTFTNIPTGAQSVDVTPVNLHGTL